MKKNIPLLKRLRTRFLRMKHPEHFNMHRVAIKTDCGAVMCNAGHILDLAGYRIRLRPKHSDLQSVQILDFITPKGRKVHDPIATARREAGLTEDEAVNLFYDFSIKTPKQSAKRVEMLIAQGLKQ